MKKKTESRKDTKMTAQEKIEKARKVIAQEEALIVRRRKQIQMKIRAINDIDFSPIEPTDDLTVLYERCVDVVEGYVIFMENSPKSKTFAEYKAKVDKTCGLACDI